ncbi:lysophosphatidylserine lipase ABHD12 [Planococcus citri]|uniref:lysophosphatidylserine lipase ABHD12 n=1 Tax=Planococcus citri TaxID=170843 RepID=UPI0031F77E38
MAKTKKEKVKSFTSIFGVIKNKILSIFHAFKKIFIGTEKHRFPLIKLAKRIFATILAFYVLLFFVIHRYSYWLQRHILFLQFVRWPLKTDFNKPEKFELKGCKNFYLSTKDGVKIGVWQILPESYTSQSQIAVETYDEAIGDGKPIIIYVHGNSGTRATYHRVQLYKLLQKNECHVIAFDYRSFGDSSYVLPDETGVVDDTGTVLKWTFEHKKNSPVYVWGHSLGTGIASRTVTEFELRGESVDGLILEAAFNNLEDAIRNHPLSVLFRHAIGYDFFFVKPIQNNGITFTTDKYLASSKIPLFILHAKDDWILPPVLGQKLYQYLVQNRPKVQESVKFVEFGKGYGHKYMCNSTALINLINLFLSGKLNEIPPVVA